MGARCNQPTLTFDALDVGQDVTEGDGKGAGAVRSWAHVVRTGVKVGSGHVQPGNPAITELQRQEDYVKQQKDERIRKEEEASSVKIASETEISKKDADKDGTDDTAADKVDTEHVDKPAEGAIILEEKNNASVNVLEQKVDGQQNEIVSQVEGNISGATEFQVEEVLDLNAGAIGDQAALANAVCQSDFVLHNDKTDFGITKSKKKDRKKQRYHSSPNASDRDMKFSSEGETEFDSMGTSKAGLSHYETDLDASFVAGSASGQAPVTAQLKLRPILPGDSSSSDSASDTSLHHKVSGGQYVEEGLPGNTRSVFNRGIKQKKNDSSVKCASDGDVDTMEQ